MFNRYFACVGSMFLAFLCEGDAGTAGGICIIVVLPAPFPPVIPKTTSLILYPGSACLLWGLGMMGCILGRVISVKPLNWLLLGWGWSAWSCLVRGVERGPGANGFTLSS